MIGALFGGFFELAKKPFLVLPSIFAAVFFTVLALFSQPIMQVIVFDLALGGNMPQANLFQLPFLLYKIYANDINILLAMAFVFGVANNWLAFCFARFAKERKSVFDAMGFATKNIVKEAYLAIFQGAILALFFVLFLLAALLGSVSPWLFLIAIIIIAVLALLAYLVLVFLPAAIAVDDLSIKDGLKNSGDFVKKRALAAIVFIFVVGLIYNLITGIGTNLADTISDDNIALAVDFAFLLVAISYASMAVPLYYVSASE